jgi:TonB family protein
MPHSSKIVACTVSAPGRLKRTASGLLSFAAVLLFFAPLPAHADDRPVVHKVPPVYPEMARRLHITGTVKVVTTIDAGGSVTKAEGLGGNKILSSAAEDAVKQWKFAAGSGVDTMTIQINFAE